MSEVWKPIQFPTNFYISNQGRLKKVEGETEYMLEPQVKQGEAYTMFNFRIHQLVAQAFLPNPNGRKRIYHRDGNKLNNTLANLHYTDAKPLQPLHGRKQYQWKPPQPVLPATPDFGVTFT